MNPVAEQADVHALMAQVEALTAEVEAFRVIGLVAKHSDNALVVTDREGLIIWANPTFERVTGYPLSDLKGHKPGELLQTRETDPSTIAYIREQIRQGLAFETDILNRRKDGEHYWAHISVKPLRDDAGDIKCFMAIQRDVTSLRRDQARQNFHHEIVQGLSQAKDVDVLLPQLLAHIGTFIGWPVGIAWEVKARRWVGEVNMTCAHQWASNPLRYAGILDASRRATWEKGQTMVCVR